MSEFTLNIELANSAMQTPRDVAAAISEVAWQVEEGKESGIARDLNGNTVGRWSVEYPVVP